MDERNRYERGRIILAKRMCGGRNITAPSCHLMLFICGFQDAQFHRRDKAGITVQIQIPPARRTRHNKRLWQGAD
jgi:hypothetical protein